MGRGSQSIGLSSAAFGELQGDANAQLRKASRDGLKEGLVVPPLESYNKEMLMRNCARQAGMA